MSKMWDKLDEESLSSAKPNRSGNRVAPEENTESKEKELDMISLAKKKPRIFNGRDKVIAIKRLNDLGNDPISILCPFCEEKVITDVDYNVGGGTWAWCGGIIGLGICNPLIWVCCLCWVPFCVPKCKNAWHKCHNCKKFLGVTKVM